MVGEFFVLLEPLGICSCYTWFKSFVYLTMRVPFSILWSFGRNELWHKWHFLPPSCRVRSWIWKPLGCLCNSTISFFFFFWLFKVLIRKHILLFKVWFLLIVYLACGLWMCYLWDVAIWKWEFFGVNVPMEFAFWLVKVLFVFKFFMGFVHSDDEINCIWVMRVILFLMLN